MRRDTFILLMPIFLTFVGMLWFLRDEWIHTQTANVLVSLFDSLLVILKNSV